MSRHGHGVQLCASWVRASDGHVPPNAISAGDGCYVARANISGDVVPGKVPHGHKCAYLPYDGKENSVREYEVLCDTGLHCFGHEYEWQYASNGEVPQGALVAGKTSHGEPLYVARCNVNGELCVGKVHASHNCAYFPWGGKEHKEHSYEVLTLKGHY